MFIKPMKIELSESADKVEMGRIQILREGEFEHSWYGTMKFDDGVFQSMIKNFQSNVRGIEIAVNYSHNSGGEAAGWIKSLEHIDGGLFADVEWTEDAKEKIKANKFKYISAEFDTEYKDPEGGQKYGATLLGAALTNIPFVKNMNKVLSDIEGMPPEAQNKIKEFFDKQKKETKKMNFEEMLEGLKTLSEDQKKQVATSLGVKLAEDVKPDVKLSEEIASLKAELDKKDKEIQFSEMLANGKVVPSQKEAFMSGDMKAFAENAVKINLSENGTQNGGKNTDDKAGKTEDKMTSDEASAKILELAEKIKTEKQVNFAEAVSQARRQKPDLVKIITA
jgi:phage I-like protein